MGKQEKKLNNSQEYKRYVDKNLKSSFGDINERKIKPLERLQPEELIKIFLCYAWNTLVLVIINLFLCSQLNFLHP